MTPDKIGWPSEYFSGFVAGAASLKVKTNLPNLVRLCLSILARLWQRAGNVAISSTESHVRYRTHTNAKLISHLFAKPSGCCLLPDSFHLLICKSTSATQRSLHR